MLKVWGAFTGRHLLQNDDDGTDGGRRLLHNDDDGTDGGKPAVRSQYTWMPAVHTLSILNACCSCA